MRKEEIEIQCRKCGKWFKFEVDIDNFRRWYSGEGLIQNLLPDLTPWQRELLISEICEKCFKEIVGYYEEE